MKFDLQPNFLKNNIITLIPLEESHFEMLFEVASNPLVWQQHPIPNRYKREIFKTFFEGAILSKGAFLVLDSQNNNVLGSSRFYDLNTENKSIKIGYTFIGIDFWGGDINNNLKNLMINHAFEKLKTVIFDIDSQNIRSQKAITKIGATKIDEQIVEYYGKAPKLNFVYQISNTI
jgi:N-acetyltransferase